MVMNIPPSTLGYKPNECIVSIQNIPMTKTDIENIAKRDQEEYTKGNMEAPSKLHIAVGYNLVQEEVENQDRKFKTYIVPTDDRIFIPDDAWNPKTNK